MKDFQNKTLNILVPMAGEGSRLKEYGSVKPLIKIGNLSMIEIVHDNINLNGNYIYIAKNEHIDLYDIKKHIDNFCKNYIMISQQGKLNGAAASSLLAKDYIDNDVPLLIINSDQYLVWDANNFIDEVLKKYDGGILTFKESDPRFSYVLEENGLISSVVEKEVVSEKATCGVYFWKKGSDYVKYAEKMISNSIMINGEFYVGPVFNEAIKDGKKIIAIDCKEMWDLGTPESLSKFIKYMIKDGVLINE